MAITDKNKSSIERLKELSVLYEAGALTQEEMEAEKAEILNSKPDQKEPNVDFDTDEPPIDDNLNDALKESTVQETSEEEMEEALVSHESTDTANDSATDKIAVAPPKASISVRKIIIALLIIIIAIALIVALCGKHDDGTTTANIPLSVDDTDSVSVEEIVPDVTYITGMQEVLEKVSTTTTNLTEFFDMPEIANAIQNVYGLDYYKFLKQTINSNKNVHLDMEKTTDNYGYVESYSFFLTLEPDTRWQLGFAYDAAADNTIVSLFFNGNKVNPDGSFALTEGSNWKLDYERDEFGDPIKDEVFIYVESKTGTFSADDMKIVIKKGKEGQVMFYYDLPWHKYSDVNKLTSIKVKNKDDGSVHELSDYNYFEEYCILSENDSRYIRKLCDSDPTTSFSIRFDISSYDFNIFTDTEYEYAVYDFNDGRAYGLNNAIAHYFYRAY